MDKPLAEGLHLRTDGRFKAGVGVQRRGDGTRQEAGLAGHELREAGGRGYALRRDVGEMAKKRGETLLFLGRDWNYAVPGDFTDAALRDELPVLIEMEVKVVSENYVGELRLVAVELLAMHGIAVEVAVAYALRLHIANWAAGGALFAHENVRRAALNVRRLVHHLGAGHGGR